MKVKGVFCVGDEIMLDEPLSSGKPTIGKVIKIDD